MRPALDSGPMPPPTFGYHEIARQNAWAALYEEYRFNATRRAGLEPTCSHQFPKGVDAVAGQAACVAAQLATFEEPA